MSKDAGAGTPALARHTFVSGTGRHLRIYGDLRGAPEGDFPDVEPAALQKRIDLLTGAWVAISPARNVRPNTTPAAGEAARSCPLCPGGRELPFDYDAAVFDNRFPAFVADPPAMPDHPLIARSFGRCEVVVYTDRHEGSLATLSPSELAGVVAILRDRTGELWADPRHGFVLAFENHGEAVGATISHPHGQIYAVDHVPPLIAERVAALGRFRAGEGRCLGCDVVARDDTSERVIASNASFVVAVPFAARWPYEVHVRARRHRLSRLTDLRPDEQRDLAAAIRGVVHRYERLFDFEMPYMMAVLEGPAGAPDWHLAFEFYPPHRTEALTKVRASVETATGLVLNDTLPEETARRLAAIPGPDALEAPATAVVEASV